ncbi:hypothetical protein CEXT_626211 [Caerostris extrusa]|uniref:Uncharacterized protein n=1 Tax=Caerostris extrusa TaxID=172846 RepID=A0AAV4U7U9_CAEEX|nr:hypothetical protein CEXT_626211 [Caerostris extrusa]
MTAGLVQLSVELGLVKTHGIVRVICQAGYGPQLTANTDADDGHLVKANVLFHSLMLEHADNIENSAFLFFELGIPSSPNNSLHRLEEARASGQDGS